MIQPRRALGELITVTGETGFELDGIVYRNDACRTTILHIHGSFGNFYQGRLLKVMAQMYQEAGMNLLSVNTACHDGLAEGYRNTDEFEYAGGAVSDFTKSTADIGGAVDFAKQFSDRVILQGHSLGCDRVLQYLISSKTSYDFVLLAPCDSYQLQTNWIAPETVEEQIQRLKKEPANDPEFDWLPRKEYGICAGKEWTYSIPITRRAYLSIAEGPPFHLIKVKEAATFHLDQRAVVCIGGQDALQVWPHEVMFHYLQQRVSNCVEVYVHRGDHMFAGCESEVTENIIKWTSESESTR